MLLRALALITGCLALSGCSSGPKPEVLAAPRTLTAPYDTSRGEVLWAVAPLRNESGTTLVDANAMTDHLIGAVEEVAGVRSLPLNRVLSAMSALEMRGVSTPSDARTLAAALGADGIVVGTVTAFDPYAPMMGISLALYSRPGGLERGRTVSIQELRSQATEPEGTPTNWADRPLSVYSDRLDAKNHAVLMDLKTFAEGRTRQPSALGWRRYTASSDLYAQFVMYRGIDGLIGQEWTRVARVAAGAGTSSPQPTD
ncbi:MAG TPA: hypothetical protein VD971_09160 [Phycisphaerales bacterium]|nr:hypothetical protein [Phycisphaerales bacterium]